MSVVRSPRPLSHWHFGFYNPHAVGAGRLAPLSHDSLVATSCSLINFSSRAFSRWVHMDLAWGPHLESFPLLASSGALGRSGPVSGMCPRPIKAPIDRTMISAHFGLRRDSGLIWGPGPVWACFWPVSSCPCLVSNLLSMPCVYLFYFRSAFISGFMPLDRIGLS